MRLNTKHHVTTMLLGAALVFAGGAIAQDRRGDDRGGRDQRSDDRNRHEERAEYHFRQEDRNQFSSHYKSNIRQMQQHPDRRHHIRAGEQLPNDFRSHVKTVPPSYYRNVPPPPRGYQLGYYDGYVVAYNPATRIVADVLDLVDAATRR
jgi:Ni/Co efflux regulator RcnB